ncbi:MAG: hypothetical protein IJ838_02745, partial [Paludibacteraceae bacterium]|nr:hypothetical protein [Paludibacteraceae bacterium]
KSASFCHGAPGYRNARENVKGGTKGQCTKYEVVKNKRLARVAYFISDGWCLFSIVVFFCVIGLLGSSGFLLCFHRSFQVSQNTEVTECGLLYLRQVESGFWEVRNEDTLSVAVEDFSPLAWK